MKRWQAALLSAAGLGLMLAVISFAPYLRASLAVQSGAELGGGYVSYFYPQKGVYAEVPSDVVFDYTMTPDYVRGENDHFDVTFSLETAFAAEFGGDVKAYCDHYLDRFFDDAGWREKNGVTLLSQTEDDTRKLTQLRLADVPEGEPDTYLILTLYTESDLFYRAMARYSSQDPFGEEAALRFCGSFRAEKRGGEETCRFSPSLRIPESWNAETRAVFSALCTNNRYFGLFTSKIKTEGLKKTIPELEAQLDYSFPILLDYAHIIEPFPSSFMREAWDNGKIVELTLQITDCNNEDLFDRSAQLALYRGEYDETLRTFARAAADFGYPFLFRLNNEMNSDWTSWSGVVNLCDPEIYVSCWQRVYRIFEEEGVNNAIWIFNPNDVDYPLCCWNSYLAYFPGEEYVQMIGLTGYNTGTYYAQQFGERWRTFSEMYDALDREYGRFFGDYPWIITEFASSSVGGDKAAWIRDMFSVISSYDNIKAAVWFDFADYDSAGNVARPYWLGETPECISAFADGLKSWGKSLIEDSMKETLSEN